MELKKQDIKGVVESKKGIEKAVELLESFVHDIMPHIIGHKTALNKFHEAKHILISIEHSNKVIVDNEELQFLVKMFLEKYPTAGPSFSFCEGFRMGFAMNVS